MYQKRQISLPVGYKTAKPKTGDWERLGHHFRTSSFAKNRFLRHFLINNALLYDFLANRLAHNKKMTETSDPFGTSKHAFSSPEAALLLVSTKNRDLCLHSGQTTGRTRNLHTSGDFRSLSRFITKFPRSNSFT